MSFEKYLNARDSIQSNSYDKKFTNHISQVLIDGLRANTSTVKQKLAYVIQHDRLLPNLTVVETLLFVAKLAYPSHDGLELATKVNSS